VSSSELMKLFKVFNNYLELITSYWPTPLVRIKSLSVNGYSVWAKLEFFNVLSRSIKDRVVWYMLMKYLSRYGEVRKLYEASSGNVAISLAMLGRLLGTKVRIYLPKGTPETTKVILKLLGTEVVETNYGSIDWGLINYVKEVARREGAVNLNQFENEANPEVHLRYTAKELDTQLILAGESPPKAIVCGVGTSGHVSAISKYFKSRYGGRVYVVGAVPSRGSKIPGIKRLETRPKWVREGVLDYVVEVSTEEAIEEVINLARSEGLLVGLSSGAVIKAFREVREVIGGGTYVLIFPDDVLKYLNMIREYLRDSA